jgi:hypothetical protein
MMKIHLDGADVVVIDSLGRPVPSVGEVQLEPDRAFVAVHHAARAWWRSVALAGPESTLACEIYSRDGRLRWCGPVRLAST